jgi:hypothetical protein
MMYYEIIPFFAVDIDYAFFCFTWHRDGLFAKAVQI